MDMIALTVLQQLAPSVHPLDQARALQECTALVDKYKARKAYHEQMVTAEVDIFNDKLPRTNNHPENGPSVPWSERSTTNFLANVRTVFRLQRPCTCTAADLCNDCESECHAGGSYVWAMDTDHVAAENFEIQMADQPPPKRQCRPPRRFPWCDRRFRCQFRTPIPLPQSIQLCRDETQAGNLRTARIYLLSVAAR